LPRSAQDSHLQDVTEIITSATFIQSVNKEV